MDPDILIIGAGAAGIGAARRVRAAGCRALLVEASDRVGGLAFTQEIAGLALDLGCGWLHSAERNAWAALAQEAGIALDHRVPAWGRQHRDLGFPPAEQEAARAAFAAWEQALERVPPARDNAGEALPPDPTWHPYIRTITGFISGAGPEAFSAADYRAYDEAASEANWRAAGGYGALVAASLPADMPLRLATPVTALDLDRNGVRAQTPAGTIRARAAILTVSTAVLASGAIALPIGLDPWREAAAALPLGRNEKLFFEITGPAPFETETQVLGNPHDARTGAYYIRPLGLPVVEAFLGGEGADIVAQEGPAAAFAHGLGELAALLGADIRKVLRPLAGSCWSRTSRVGGSYSYARPGRSAARQALARPFANRIFFAGEATHGSDFSTAHGAHDSGVRAAQEALAALGAPPR